MSCERLEKRSVVMGFGIAFAVCGLTLLGSMGGVSRLDEVSGTVWWDAYGWLGFAFLAVNAVLHSVLIARAGNVGWAVLRLPLALPWAFNQMLAALALPLFVVGTFGFGLPAVVGTNLVLAAIAFAWCYRLTRAPRALVQTPYADWAAVEAEADIDRVLNPEGDLRKRFAALDKARD